MHIIHYISYNMHLFGIICPKLRIITTEKGQRIDIENSPQICTLKIFEIEDMLPKIKPLHIETPIWNSHELGKNSDSKVGLKMEALQPSGSFKIRGIGLLVQEAHQSGCQTIVASSGGNAGLSATYAARSLNLDALVVVPESTPKKTIARLENYGANVKVYGTSWIDAHEHAMTLASKLSEQWAYIHPFDHPTIWKGHSTIIDELVRGDRKPDSIALSVGGGGLLLGILEGLKRHQWTDVKVYAIETIGAESLHTSLKKDRLVTLDAITSDAKSLGAKTVAQEAFKQAKEYGVKSLTVTDQQAWHACKQMANEQRVLVEPSCGATLAAINERRLPPGESIIAIACGGNSITLENIMEKT